MTPENPNLKPLRPRLSTGSLPAEAPPKPIVPTADFGYPLPKPTLTFTDGLNFGCGFWVAGILTAIVGGPVAALAFGILTAILRVM